jgi:hypothetical protein
MQDDRSIGNMPLLTLEACNSIADNLVYNVTMSIIGENNISKIKEKALEIILRQSIYAKLWEKREELNPYRHAHDKLIVKIESALTSELMNNRWLWIKNKDDIFGNIHTKIKVRKIKKIAEARTMEYFQSLILSEINTFIKDQYLLAEQRAQEAQQKAYQAKQQKAYEIQQKAYLAAMHTANQQVQQTNTNLMKLIVEKNNYLVSQITTLDTFISHIQQKISLDLSMNQKLQELLSQKNDVVSKIHGLKYAVGTLNNTAAIFALKIEDLMSLNHYHHSLYNELIMLSNNLNTLLTRLEIRESVLQELSPMRTGAVSAMPVINIAETTTLPSVPMAGLSSRVNIPLSQNPQSFWWENQQAGRTFGHTAEQPVKVIPPMMPPQGVSATLNSLPASVSYSQAVPSSPNY